MGSRSRGSLLVDVLRAVSYPGVGRLDASSLDWMFDDEAAGPFLNWLLGSISEDNVVPPDVRRKYEELDAKGETLHGDALQTALRSFESASSEQIRSVDDIRREVAELQTELDQLSDRERLLRRLSDDLSSQAESLNLRNASLESVASLEKKEFTKRVGACEQAVAQVVSAVESIYKIEEDLGKVYNASQSSGRDTRRSLPFVSMQSIDTYMEQERSYNAAVAEFTKKKFSEAISDVASQADEDYYVLLDVKDPQSIVAYGDTHGEAVRKECEELRRMQATHSRSALHHITAQLDKDYAAAALAAVRNFEAHLADVVASDDAHLRTELERLSEQCCSRRQQIATQREGPLRDLLRDSSAASEACILTGNFDLKLARQNYVIGGQEQLIDMLLDQCARFTMLKMLYSVEKWQHAETRSLMNSVHEEIDEAIRGYERRLKALRDTSFLENAYDRATVDARCTWIVSLAELLGLKCSSQRPFFTYDDVAVIVKETIARVDEHRSRKERLQSNYAVAIEKLDGAVRRTLTCIGFPASETRLTDPSVLPVDFAPRAFANGCSKLEAELASLEAAILDLLKAVDQNKKIIKRDPAVRIHRQLFRIFYTAPHQLKDFVKDLSDARLL